jgi:hypothetical protein
MWRIMSKAARPGTARQSCCIFKPFAHLLLKTGEAARLAPNPVELVINSLLSFNRRITIATLFVAGSSLTISVQSNI